MKKTLLTVSMALMMIVSCTREDIPNPQGYEGGVVIGLSQDPRNIIIETKADDPEILPSIDSFSVEIYNSKAIRLYRDKYDKAKGQTIKLNAGEFRLVAHHGDSLGCGFSKPYYLADKSFTVHGYKENGGQPDKVEAVAKLGNVKVKVNYGENLSSSYSNYYTFVRHAKHTSKYVKFSKTETRSAYIPGGEVYLEVYAQLGGSGVQDGGVKDSLVYFKSETFNYSPNDYVTFNIETDPRFGGLGVNILIDKAVETVESTYDIPSYAAPFDGPQFSHGGTVTNSFSYGFAAGAKVDINDAILSVQAKNGLKGLVLNMDSDYLTSTVGLPKSIDLAEITPSQKELLLSKGLKFLADTTLRMGYIDFSGLISQISQDATYSSTDPTFVSFTVGAVDKMEKQSSASFKLTTVPLQAKFSAEDVNIWGWKIVSPTATLTNASSIADISKIKMQYSTDGESWLTADAVSAYGNKVIFDDANGLVAGKPAFFRTIYGGNDENVSAVSSINTENPDQVGNSGFEDYTENIFKTNITLSSSKFTVYWWQLYKEGEDAWWAVNSPVTLNTQVSAAYQDFKTYPTVALVSNDAYAGNTSAVVATIAIGDNASLISYGTAHGGELFIGSANNLNEGSWAKVSEGHSFSTRPSALKFMYKFDCQSNDPFYAYCEVKDTDGNVIATGKIDTITENASSWTELSIPLTYTVTDKKAGSIFIDFKSSAKNATSTRSYKMTTISGEHTVHAGSVLYLDDIRLLYE
ncbi:MAG: DUF4493 domain-containing protein [Bacteroidales bacterium]|nr:DUF4493 domain-containing protein [Bacteroidales bacterium]